MMHIHLWNRVLLGLISYCIVPFVYGGPSNQHSKPHTLVYTTIRPSYWEIYLKEHGHLKQLTHGDALNYNPVFSPDGKWLVFSSEKTGTGFLYALNLTNLQKEPIRLTHGPYFEDTPSFSPDGKYLYYMSTRDGGNANIYKIPFSPRTVFDQKQAINITKNKAANLHPAVSPDGQWIAFSSNRDSDAQLITNPRPSDNYRATDLFLIKTDGTHVKRLTNNHNWTGSPCWSADGKSIYFYAVTNKIPRIYRMQSDGSKVQAISPNHLYAVSPTLFQKNRVAFVVNQDNHWRLASTTIEGKDFRYETDSSSPNTWAPAYHAKTQRMAFYRQAAQGKNVFYDEVIGGKYMDKPMATGPFLVSHHAKQIADQTVSVYAVRGYFPNYIPSTDKIISVSQFAKVVMSNPDGNAMRTIYQAPSEQMIIGLGSTLNGESFVVGVGMPFSPINQPANIWKFSLSGNDMLNLTQSTEANNVFPRYLVDGKKIVFRSGRTGHKHIFSMDNVGKKVQELTTGNTLDTMPDISTKSNAIVFASVRNEENYHIYLLEINSNGTPDKLTQLTNGSSADVHPTFSPNGQWIAFASERQGYKDEAPLNPIFSPQPYGEVYIMRLSDKKIIPLTDNKWEDSLPNWR